MGLAHLIIAKARRKFPPYQAVRQARRIFGPLHQQSPPVADLLCDFARQIRSSLPAIIPPQTGELLFGLRALDAPWNGRIEQHEQSWLRAFGMELLGHLKSDQASKGDAAEQVGSLGIERSKFLDISGCQLFEADVVKIWSIYERGAEDIERLVRAESFGQRLVDKGFSTEMMEAEKRNL